MRAWDIFDDVEPAASRCGRAHGPGRLRKDRGLACRRPLGMTDQTTGISKGQRVGARCRGAITGRHTPLPTRILV